MDFYYNKNMESLNIETKYTIETIPEELIQEYLKDAMENMHQMFDFTPTNTEYFRLRDIAKETILRMNINSLRRDEEYKKDPKLKT